jgi:pimeloyl-ACP methyl ester carboxylesterase
VATVSSDGQEHGLPPLTYLGRLRGHPSVLGERRIPSEYRSLVGDPVFAGEGVPDGRGRPVLLIPGFLSGDATLHVMRGWLQRSGYQVELPGIVCNLWYSEVVMGHLLRRLLDMFGWHGRKVTLIGHSRGGMLAKVLADRHPEMVRQVVGLGAPLADPYDVHPMTVLGIRIAQIVNLVRFARTADMELSFLADLAAPPGVPVTSIYTRTDGIVYWEACLRSDVDCLEVTGSHLGLTMNREVYAALALLLAGSGNRTEGRSGAPSSDNPSPSVRFASEPRSRRPRARRGRGSYTPPPDVRPLRDERGPAPRGGVLPTR